MRKFDITGKLDLCREQDIVIHRQPSVGTPTPRPVVAESADSSCDLVLSLQSADVCSYESLTGVLRSVVHEDLLVSRVVVALDGYERFGGELVPSKIDEVVSAQDEML